MSKYIEDVETDIVSLEVWECECGFHIGLDSTYLDQVENAIKIQCPSCYRMITTELTHEA